MRTSQGEGMHATGMSLKSGLIKLKKGYLKSELFGEHQINCEFPGFSEQTAVQAVKSQS